MFWGGVLLLGVIVVGSGLVLDKLLPTSSTCAATMQVAHMVHAVATVLMMALFLGHIYIGTIGMRGAYRAMRDGYVDEDWAAEHHALLVRRHRGRQDPGAAQPTPAPQPARAAPAETESP